MLGRWGSFCNPAIAAMLVYADPDQGNGAPVTAAARFRAEPGGAGLRHPIPARPPRSHDAHLRQFFPHRCRLLRLSTVGLLRSLARMWVRADASLSRRLGSRDDRPAFLAEGTPL